MTQMRFESDPTHEVGIRFEKMRVVQDVPDLRMAVGELLSAPCCFILAPDQAILDRFAGEPDPTHAALLAALNKEQSRIQEGVKWVTAHDTQVNGQDAGFGTDFGLPGSSSMIVDQKITPFDGDLTVVTAHSKVGHVSPYEASYLTVLLATGKTDERYAEGFQRANKLDASEGVRLVYTSVVGEGKEANRLLYDFRGTPSDHPESIGWSPEGTIRYIGSLSTATSVVQ